MSDEFDELAETFERLAVDIKSSKQAIVAKEACERLDALKLVQGEVTAAQPRPDDVVCWAASKDAVEKNRYALSLDDCYALGNLLIESNDLGVKMAGIELAADAIHKELSSQSNRSINRFKAILKEPEVADAPELAHAEKLAEDFRQSIALLWTSTEDDTPQNLSPDVLAAIRKIKNTYANRELVSWLDKQLKELSKRHNAESEALMEVDDVHEILEEAVEALCNNAREISVNLLDGQVAAIEAICCFSFGMAKEFSDRAELEDAPDWSFSRTIASVANSLIAHGIPSSAVTFYKSMFFDVVFKLHASKLDSDMKAWIQAGATSMDKFCRSDLKEFEEDFKLNLMVFARKNS
jgi:hypothetical protein